MSELREWKSHPQTREFRRELERRVEEIRAETSISWENADYTQAMTGKKMGKLEAIENIIEELMDVHTIE